MYTIYFKNKISTKLTYITLAVLLISTVFLFKPGLDGPYLFDDWQVLVQSNFISDPVAAISGYRPVRNISYFLDLQFGKMEPYTFHFSNLCYHLANILFLFFLLNKLLRNRCKQHLFFSFAITAIFAVHPVQIESVTYISGRRDILFTFFYLGGALFFLNLYKNGKLKLALIILLLFTALSMGAKEAGITLPVFIFILLPYFENIKNFDNKKIKQKKINFIKNIKFMDFLWLIIGFILLSMIIFFSFYLFKMVASNIHFRFMGDSIFTHFENCAVFAFKYIVKLFYPVNLAADYSAHSFQLISKWNNPLGLISFFMGIIFTFGALFQRFYIRKKNKIKPKEIDLISAGWLWFIITILPMINLVPHVERFALHYLYLPLSGIFLSFTGIILYFSHGKKKTMYIFSSLFSIFIIYCSYTTSREIKWWLNDIIFWEHNIMVNPLCVRAHVNLGMNLLKYNKYDRAEKSFQTAIKIEDSDHAYLGLATIALDKQDTALCKQYLNRLTKNDMRVEIQRLFLNGLLAVSENNIETASQIASKILKDWPKYDGGYYLKGTILNKLKKYNKSVSYFEKAVLINKKNGRNVIALIRVLIECKRWNQALLLLEDGFQLNLWEKNDANRLNDIGYVLLKMGHIKDAKKYFTKIIVANVPCVDVCLKALLNLSYILLENGNYKEVIKLKKSLDVTLDQKESVSKLLNNIGLAYIYLKQMDNGLKEMQKAFSIYPENEQAKRNLLRLIFMTGKKTK